MRPHRIFYKLEWGKTLACIRNVRVLHLMHNDKFGGPFIDFVTKHFNDDRHVFVFYGGYSEDKFPIPRRDNVIVLRDTAQFWILHLLLRRAQKVLLHGLFVAPTIALLRRQGRLLAKCFWIIWGGDLYEDLEPKPREGFALKKQVVQRLGGIIAAAKADFDLACRAYDFRGPYQHAVYKTPLDAEVLDACHSPREANRDLIIQVNNSADASVLEVLQLLGRFKGKPMKVRPILSYGDPAVREKALVLGRELFGENFIPVLDYMSPKDYARLLSTTDILVMNQQRQQGLGNILALLYDGAKVYIRRDISTWSFLESDQIHVFDTLSLAQGSYEDFVRVDPGSRDANRARIAKYFDENYLASLWRAVFAG